MGDLDFLLLWSSCSTEFFSQLEMSRAWVCVEWIEGAQTRNLWTLWSWNISNFRILLVELCRRMPPRKNRNLHSLCWRPFLPYGQHCGHADNSRKYGADEAPGRPKKSIRNSRKPKSTPPTPSYASIHFVPQSSCVGRLQEIGLYSSFGQQSHGHLAHFLPLVHLLPWFISDKAPS